MPNPDREIVRLATQHFGVFSREQAHATGLTDDRLRHRVRQGWFEQVGPNAFRLAGADVTPLAQLAALMVDVGPPCFAFGPTAAALHGFDGFELGAPFHLVIPRGRQVRRIGHSIHTSQHLPESDCTVVDGIVMLRAARTLIDLARLVDRRTLTVAYDSAVRDRRIDEDALARRLVRLLDHRRLRLGAEQLLQVINGSEVERGAHSYLERRFLELMAEHDLPIPETQRVLGRTGERVIRVDFRFPDTNLTVEVLGHRYHRSRAQISTDAARMNQLLADGYQPYQFTYDQVTERPHQVVDMVARALSPPAA